MNMRISFVGHVLETKRGLEPLSDGRMIICKHMFLVCMHVSDWVMGGLCMHTRYMRANEAFCT